MSLYEYDFTVRKLQKSAQILIRIVRLLQVIRLIMVGMI